MGPLAGLRVVEFSGIGPGPFCGMMLADMGAEVIRIDRTDSHVMAGSLPARFDVLRRGRRSIGLDLKLAAGADAAMRLVEQADGLIEGFRPGVMERLGLGPEECLRRNPRLVYGRMTGWGQTGTWKDVAGHDINYIALTGALHSIGPVNAPAIPLNLLGDFGGGGMLLAFGLMCGIWEAQRSGKGQVVDAAMTDGAALLMNFVYGMRAAGKWSNQRESNLVDGGMPFYRCYECADGRWVAVGPIEPRFFAVLVQGLGLSGTPGRAELEVAFRAKTRDEWCSVFEGTDACVAPVLNVDEAPRHSHNLARGSFTEVDGVTQAAPAPRFSRTPGGVNRGAVEPGANTVEALLDWGFSEDEVAALRASGAIR